MALQATPGLMVDAPPFSDMGSSVEKDSSEPAVRQISAASNQTGQVNEIRTPSLDDGDVQYRTLSWWRAGTLMIAETISLGILSLPSALATLGFLPGIVVILFLGACASYTGYIIYQLKLRNPTTRSYADAFEILFGAPGRWIAEVMTLMFLAFVMAAHILTFTVSMNVLTNHGICTVIFYIVGTVVSLLLTVPITLKGNSWASLASCISICIAVVIAMIAIGIRRPDAFDTYLVTPSSKTSLANGAASVSCIVIAFTGHVAYFQIIDEMKQPHDFPKALALLQCAALTFYLVVAVVIYTFAGQYVGAPALGSASPLVRKICYGIALPTIIVAGVITANICAKRCYQVIWRNDPKIMAEKSLRGRGSWLAIISVIWALAFVLAESIPVFGEMLGIIGAGFTTWFCLGANSILWLSMQRAGVNDGKSRLFANWKKISLLAINVLIIAVSAIICGAGLYGSGVTIAKIGVESTPFSCADNSVLKHH